MNLEERLVEIKTVLSKRRILVVEDVENANSTYCELLQTDGFLVDGARNLEEAVSALDVRTYHVALVDIMLAGNHEKSNRDGLKILNMIKASRYGTRSIVLSGQDDPQLAIELILQFGANDYMDKGRFIVTFADELTTRVRCQDKKCKINLYGDEKVISFLAGFGHEAAWADQCLRMLKVRGGYIELERFFSGLCDPVAPLVPQKAKDTAIVDKKAGVMAGKYWSKALALPIMVVAGQGDAAHEFFLSGKMPELQSDGLLVRYSGQGLSGLIFELRNISRSEFEP